MSLIKLLNSKKQSQISALLKSDYNHLEKESETNRNLLHFCVDLELTEILKKLIENFSNGKKIDLFEKDSSGDVG